MAAALDAYPLHREIEPQLVVRRNVVVIDARPQELAGAGTRRLEGEALLARAQREGRGPGAVDDPDDDRLAAAVLKEVLERVREPARLPQSAEGMLELDETRDQHRTVERPAQGAPDKRRPRGVQARNRAVGTSFLL